MLVAIEWFLCMKSGNTHDTSENCSGGGQIKGPQTWIPWGEPIMVTNQSLLVKSAKHVVIHHG